MHPIPSEWLNPPSIQAATLIQRQMAERVVTEDQFPEIKLIAGMDVSNNPRDPSQNIFASVVLLDTNLKIIQTTNVKQKQEFPYISGFLAFREAPALVEAFQQLQQKPDVIFIDGHGISHPRGLGIASHIGVLLDCPTIGVAKSILVGKPANELEQLPGSQTPLVWHGKTLGMLIRTKARSNPLIISPGHKICLETAISLVQKYLQGYRLPEPTRQAHLAANAFRKKF